MLESLIVWLIVAAAAAYAAWVLMPTTARQRLALRLARGLGDSAAPGLRGRSARWLRRLGEAPASSCGSCPVGKQTPAERSQQGQRRN